MLYIARIFKSWGARDAERRWVNNYEIESPAVDPNGVQATVNAIVAAEKLLHFTEVQFLSATISTWEPDSDPYNPLAFTTIDLSGTGARVIDTSQHALDANVCFVVKFTPALGRSGRRFYRGCLQELDVMIGGDARFQLHAASPVNTGQTTWNAFNTAMAPLLAGGASADSIVLAGSGGGSVEREVASLKVGGVSISRRNHRYFDRAVG